MEINFYGKNIHFTESMKDYATKKLKKIKIKNNKNNYIKIVITKENKVIYMKVIALINEKFIHYSIIESDYYACVDKLVHNIKKHIEKQNRHKRNINKKNLFNNLFMLDFENYVKNKN